MKYLFLLLGFFFSAFTVNAQRVVLLEDFSNIGCVPCVLAKPAFDTLVARNKDKVVVIQYRARWPGKDGFNAMNPGDNQARIIYYQVTSLPWVEANGQMFFSSSLKQEVIDTMYNTPEMIKLSSSYQFSKAKDSLNVTVELTPKKALSEGSSLFVAVTAGEYSDVLRQFLTPANGTPLNAGKGKQSFHFNAATINNQYFHHDKLKIVCFVQDMKTKKILSAAESRLINP